MYKPEYPKTLHEEWRVKIVKPNAGKHSGYYVHADGKLLCVCTYRKGAFALKDYIIGLKNQITGEVK